MHTSSSSRRRRASVGTGTLALSLGLCLCAGQLVAAAPATAAPVLAAASTSVTPRITTGVDRSVIYRGQAVKVYARVVNPRTGRVITRGYVRLQAYKSGAWRNVKSASIRSTGWTWAYAWPAGFTHYRMYYPAQSGNHAAGSNAAGVWVKTRPVAAGTRVLAEAKRHTGALYLYGAAGPYRFDCSGFTQYVYRKTVGKTLPHRANSQQAYGRGIAQSQKQIGDLIVFRSGSYGYHVGIYAGGGYMYDSPHSGARVGAHKIWSSNYVVRRLAA